MFLDKGRSEGCDVMVMGFLSEVGIRAGVDVALMESTWLQRSIHDLCIHEQHIGRALLPRVDEIALICQGSRFCPVRGRGRASKGRLCLAAGGWAREFKCVVGETFGV